MQEHDACIGLVKAWSRGLGVSNRRQPSDEGRRNERQRMRASFIDGQPWEFLGFVKTPEKVVEREKQVRLQDRV